MQIEKKIEGDKMTLKVVGRLDPNTSPDFEAAAKTDGTREVVIDFSGLEYISSAGLRVLLTIQKAMTACGGTMTIESPNESVKSVFEITGCSDIFTIA